MAVNSAESLKFAADTLAAMRRRGDPVAVGPDVLNPFYARGVSQDYKANGNPFDNRFNDFCGLLRVLDGDKASIIAQWPCTIDPGKQYVHNRINPDGAAAIAEGYYDGWHVGMHPMSRPNHEALVQDAGPVTVYSDNNEDGSTEGDKTRTGMFGINQHGPGTGYGDRLLTDIGPVSAGCLVRPSMPMHREFMRLVKTDARYLANKRHVFGTSIFNAKDIVGASAVPVTSGYRSLIGGFFSSPERTDLPASIRYNNPGAINAVAWNKALPGYAGDKNLDGANTIAIFYTPEQGTAMWWEWMRRARAAGVVTIEDIMVRYGGSGQVEKYREYARTIAGWMGEPVDTEINIDDDASLLPFARALFRYEAGPPSPLTDAQIIYGFNYARNGFKPPVDEPVDDPVDETPLDPIDDGEKPKNVAEAISRVEASLAATQTALTELKETIRMAQPAQTQFDWGALLVPLAKELLPKFLPVLMPLIIQLLPQLLPLLLKGLSGAQPQAQPQQQSGPGTGFWPGLLGGLLSAFAGYKGWVPVDVAVAGAGSGAGLTYAAQTGATDKLLNKNKGG